MTMPEIKQIAIEGAKLLRDNAAAQPDTDWHFEYSPETFSTAELEFSLEVCEAVMAVLHPERGQLICLIKPQFELRREDVGTGGIVRDPALHEQAVARIRRFVEGCAGFRWRGCVPSPIKGTDGNTEFLAWVTRSSES